MSSAMQIYFAEDGHGKIKVGISKNAGERITHLGKSGPHPLKLLGVIEGDHPTERALHRKLRSYCVRGEWYRDCPEVRAAIQHCLNQFKVVPEPKGRARRNRWPMFGPVAKILWPNKTDAYLAVIAGTTDRQARQWIRGVVPPPWPVVRAIMDRLLEPADD